MATAAIARGTCWEDSGVSCMARINGQDGTAITQGSLNAISCAVYSAGTLVVSPTVVVATSVFNTLQTDDRWTVDSTGYNFRHDLASTVFSTGDTSYRVEYKFTPGTGQVWFVVFEVFAKALYTS